MGRGLGYVPSVTDTRDVSASANIQAWQNPRSVDKTILQATCQTRDQGSLGSCTAFAVGQAVRSNQIQQLVFEYTSQGMAEADALTLAQRETEFWADLFLYFAARAFEGNEKEDVGTQIRYIFRAANQIGFPRNRVWTYDDNPGVSGKFSKMPSSEAFRQAFDQKLASNLGGNPLVRYSRILEEGADRIPVIKHSIATGKLVVFGTRVTNALVEDDSANGGKPFAPPKDLKDIAGGHAMVGGGYDENGMKTLTSWGKGYGDEGWFSLSWEYMTWDMTQDLWVVDTAPLYVRI